MLHLFTSYILYNTSIVKLQVTELWTNRNKHNISERPKGINNLSRFGDLEGDTIFGKDTKDRLLTHVDRKTGILSISLVRNYDACKIYKQTTKGIKRIFGEVKSITYDNGSEFTLYEQTEEELKIIICFANQVL